MTGSGGFKGRAGRGGRGEMIGRPSFTLVELLVVVSIIALLLALMVPSLVSVREEAKRFVCMDHGRAVAMDFRIFADSYAHGYRGGSEALGSRFEAVDFVESLYGSNEFWDSVRPGEYAKETYRRGQKPIICPSGPYGLARVAPATRDIRVEPRDKVSYAMNRRLFLAPAYKHGSPVEARVRLRERVLDYPYVPLMFDVDSQAALESVHYSFSHHLPFFCTPICFTRDYWFPARRHRGKLNVSFVGGHVLPCTDPQADRQWDWEYHPALEN